MQLIPTANLTEQQLAKVEQELTKTVGPIIAKATDQIASAKRIADPDNRMTGRLSKQAAQLWLERNS